MKTLYVLFLVDSHYYMVLHALTVSRFLPHLACSMRCLLFCHLTKELESPTDDESFDGEEEEGETTALEQSTVVDDPTLNPTADQSALNTERSAPPTRQKDGQPLEPLHEVCFTLACHIILSPVIAITCTTFYYLLLSAVFYFARFAIF